MSHRKREINELAERIALDAIAMGDPIEALTECLGWSCAPDPNVDPLHLEILALAKRWIILGDLIFEQFLTDRAEQIHAERTGK